MPAVNIQINVSDEAHDPIEGAKVTLFDSANQVITTSVTNGQGLASFNNEYTGDDSASVNWKVVAQKTGFRSVGFKPQDLILQYTAKGFAHLHAVASGGDNGGDNGGGGDPQMISVTVNVKAMTINDDVITLSNTPVDAGNVTLFNQLNVQQATGTTDANGQYVFSLAAPNGVTSIDGWFVLFDKVGYEGGIGADVTFSSNFTGNLVLYVRATT